MPSLGGSVGEGGQNRSSDVKLVQRLLNQHSLPPLRELDVDGIVGPATIDAIRHFQSVRVGMRLPDGRVDPGGRTLRQLRDVDPGKTPSKEPSAESPETRRAARKRQRDFVNPNVNMLPLTRRIIDAIQPHFEGVNAKVKSGYLTDAELFWKVNYHWELLVWFIDHTLTLDISQRHKRASSAIRSALMTCKPDPDTGYMTGRLGRPADRSSVEEFDRRYRILRQSKRDFKRVINAADLKTKSMRRSKDWDLSVAPVAHPGTSKHSTGYALDIEGNNRQIVAICKSLSASLTFDEDSHVHVEFKNGVRTLP